MSFSRSGFVRYFKNTGWLVGDRFVQMGVGLLVTIALARYLGPDLFGQLNFVLASVFLLGIVANFGLYSLTRRELVNRPGESNEILGTYILLTAVFALFIYAGMAAVALGGHGSTVKSLLFLILGAGFLAAPLKGIELLFQAQVQSKYATLPHIIAIITTGALKMWFIYKGMNILWIASGFLCETVLYVSMLLSVYRIRIGPFRAWRFDYSIAAQFISKSWTLMLSAVAMNVYMKLDQVMLGIMVNDSEVGIYSAAVRLSTIWYFIPTVLATSLLPAILKAQSESKEKYLARVRQFFGLNACIAYAIIIPVMFAGPLLIRWIYGTEFSEAGPILVVHILSAVLVFLHIARQQVLLAEGLYALILLSALSGATVNILLNLFLIPQYGGMGAAIATVIAQSVGVLLINFFHKDTRPLGRQLLHSLFLPWKSLFTS